MNTQTTSLSPALNSNKSNEKQLVSVNIGAQHFKDP